MAFDWFKKGNKTAVKLAAPARSSTELSDEMNAIGRSDCREAK
jgi:hypothetical protein